MLRDHANNTIQSFVAQLQVHYNTCLEKEGDVNEVTRNGCMQNTYWLLMQLM